MNPIKLIKDDHRAVKDLLRKFERANRDKEREKIGQQIVEELSIHAVIEEQLIYPLLRELDEQHVLEALEEHHAMKLTLAELDNMSADDDRYEAKMHVIKEEIETHIEQEESELLPQLEVMLEREDANELAENILQAKRIAPNHPHPMAPDEPPAGIVGGIVGKMMDVGKDVVRKISSPEKSKGHDRVVRRAKARPRAQVRRGGVKKRRVSHAKKRRASR